MTIPSCLPNVDGIVVHHLTLPKCCPYSGNPQEGSTITLSYRPIDRVYPLEWLDTLVKEYQGGHSERNIRNIEEMIQDLAVRAAESLGVRVRVRADLKVTPPHGEAIQNLHMIVRAAPSSNEPR